MSDVPNTTMIMGLSGATECFAFGVPEGTKAVEFLAVPIDNDTSKIQGRVVITAPGGQKYLATNIRPIQPKGE